MNEYLPSHITEAHVYINHDGVPMMTALWNGEPWIFVWRNDPPTWVSHMDMRDKSSMWDAMPSPLWQRKWMSQEQADLYHMLAFPTPVPPPPPER